MKVRIEMSSSEMMAIKSFATLFDDISMETKKRKIEEFTNHTKQTIIENADGSYEMEFSASDLLTITITNWMRDVVSQCKGLILGAIDTYKNIVAMMGIKKLIVDGDEVTMTKKIKIDTCVENVHITAVQHVDVNMDNQKAHEELAAFIQHAKFVHQKMNENNNE